MTEKISNWLGIEDFFNYYLAGLLWISDILILFEVLDHSSLVKFLERIGKLNQIVLTGLVILAPYILGIILSFSSSVVHKIDEILLGKPKDYVLNREKRKKFCSWRYGTYLGEDITSKIEELTIERFGEPSESSYYNIEHCLQFAPSVLVQNNIKRIKNLMNLHESFIFPIFLGSLIAFFASKQFNSLEFAIIGFILIILTVGIWYRYHYFREILAKRIYRYFYLWQTFFQLNNVEMTNKAMEQ